MERLRTTGAILALVLAAAVTTGCDAFTRDINPRQYLGKEPEMTILLAEYHGPDARNTANRVAAELTHPGLERDVGPQASLAQFGDDADHLSLGQLRAKRDRPAAEGHPSHDETRRR